MAQDIAQLIIDKMHSGKVVEILSDAIDSKEDDYDNERLQFNRRRRIQWSRNKEYKIIESVQHEDDEEDGYEPEQYEYIGAFSNLQHALLSLLSFGTGIHIDRYRDKDNLRICKKLKVCIDKKTIGCFDVDKAQDAIQIADTLII